MEHYNCTQNQYLNEMINSTINYISTFITIVLGFIIAEDWVRIVSAVGVFFYTVNQIQLFRENIRDNYNNSLRKYLSARTRRKK